MRITLLFNCLIATRHIEIEEVLMDSRNGTQEIVHYGGSRQDVSKTFRILNGCYLWNNIFYF